MSYIVGGGFDTAAELIEDAPCGIVVTDPDGRLRYVNATLAHWLGLPPGGDAARPTLASLLTGPGRIFYDTHLAPMMRLQGFAREISCRLDTASGTPLPVLLSGVSRRDAEGHCLRHDFTVFDARERHAYEKALQQAKREADELAAIVSSSPNAILRVDAAGHVRSWNAGATRLIGRSAEEAVGQPVARIVALTDRPGWFAEEMKGAGRGAEIVFEASQPDGRELEVTMAPIGTHGLPGVSEDWSVILRDITRRKHAERRLKVILGEMRHRMKNTLGVVAGLARQTLPKPHAESFVSRLQALSAAHDALGADGAEDMSGGGAAADLRLLIDTAARTAGDPARFEIDGPAVRLTARQATSLSMALHELVTNALKYGALSCESGRVRIDYRLDEATGRLSLRWRERGGPTVVPPTRRGFGTKMIGMVLKAELGGEIDFEFAPEGFSFEVVFPTR